MFLYEYDHDCKNTVRCIYAFYCYIYFLFDYTDAENFNNTGDVHLAPKLLSHFCCINYIAIYGCAEREQTSAKSREVVQAVTFAVVEVQAAAVPPE